MFADRKRLAMGGAAVAVLVTAIWLMWPASPAPSAAGSAARARDSRKPAEAAQPMPVAPVKLGALSAEREQPSGAPRNPFRFQPKPAPAPPKPVAPPAAVDTAKPAGPVVPPGPPPLPPIPLKFIGILERADGQKWAVLSDGKVTLHGKDGDNIDGRYRIVKIGTESIEMTYLDGRGRQVIRLTGQ